MINILKRHQIFFISCGFFIITCIFFSPVFLEGKVPFPANLLVSTYGPWKYSPDSEYPNGPPNKPMGFDNIRQIFPYKTINKEYIGKGSIPLWNPYIFSGTPHLAAYDSAVLYPLNILTIGFHPMTAWTILVIIQPLLAGFFMMLLLRKFRFPLSVQLFGSFTYAFSGWMIGYWEEVLVLEHTVLWMPLAFYASLLVWETDSRRKGFSILVFSLVFSILAGFFQMALYVIVCTALWNAFLFFRKGNGKDSFISAWYVFLAFGIAILVTSIQWIPSLEAFLVTPRSATDSIFLFKKYLLPIEHVVTFLIPDFWGNPGAYNYFSSREGFYFEKLIYIGIVPLLFALYGFRNSIERYSHFWKVASVVSLSLGFALPTSWVFHYLHIPVLSSALPTRIFGVFCFFVSVLSAYGFSIFIKNKRNDGLKQLLLIVTIVFFFIWVFLAFMLIAKYFEGIYGVLCASGRMIDICICRIVILVKQLGIRYSLYGSITFRNAILPTGILILGWVLYIMRNRSIRLVYLVTGIALFISSFYFAWKLTYFSESRFVFPEIYILKMLREVSGYNRVWGYGNAFIEKNFLVPYKIYSTDGYGAIFSRDYAELLSGIQNEGKMSTDIRRSDADLFEVSERESFGKGNVYRLRVMSLLGVRYILETKKGPDKDYLSPEDRFPAKLFTLVFEDDTWRIWEYTKALPRAFFASNIETVTDDQKLFERIYDPASDLRHTIFVSSGEAVENDNKENGQSGEGIVHILAYESSKVILSVEAPSEGAIFLSDTYYPGWNATVDGKKTEILKADYAFRAVLVEKGKHTIEFIYQPISVIIGFVLTVVGLVFFVIVIYISFMIHAFRG